MNRAGYAANSTRVFSRIARLQLGHFAGSRRMYSVTAVGAGHLVEHRVKRALRMVRMASLAPVSRVLICLI